MEKTEKKSKKKIGSIISSVITIVLIVLIIFMIARILVSKAKGEVFFLFNKYSAVYVVSGSMEPGIPTNSYILIEKSNGENLQVGDVITFKSEDPTIKGQLNTHRITEVESSSYKTKGDNNQIGDNYPVPKENVVGKYIGNLGFLTKLTSLFASFGGLVVVSLLIVVTTAITIIRMFKSQDPSEKTKDKKELEMEKRIQEEIARLKEADKGGQDTDERKPK